MPTMDEVRKRLTDGKNVRAKVMADAVGMSLSAFYAACERGDIETIAIGRTKLIPAHEGMRLLGIKPEPIAA
ncbi:DNA-binding protein [Methylobacterium sp. W2]|uniref:DNA-binding protein n=1 Tax=Methylobacterium sp. W2 TaxID=2598107 RepID=UPI001D0C510D|nr:DNA-binding protein [Methylobacterium sp. W2]MCC0808062.1 DNA-binding protein [Methylobacterium sp. W2]